MSRWEGCRATAPSLRSPGRAHLLTTRCARGGIPPFGWERALSEGATLPAGSGRLRPACVCYGTRISFAKRNKTMGVMRYGDLPHGIEDRQPGNGTLRCGGVCLHELYVTFHVPTLGMIADTLLQGFARYHQ